MIGAGKNRREAATLRPPQRCKHDYPILVSATWGGSKRAQCLGCQELGPESKDSEQARERLLARRERDSLLSQSSSEKTSSQKPGE